MVYVLKLISNYLSILIILIISIVLANHFIQYISEIQNNALKALQSKDEVFPITIINNTKFIVINKSIGEVKIIGDYETIINSTDFLVISTKTTEKIIIVANGEIYEI
jgi:hypothetical protein